jgi:hypothetical protein
VQIQQIRYLDISQTLRIMLQQFQNGILNAPQSCLCQGPRLRIVVHTFDASQVDSTGPLTMWVSSQCESTQLKQVMSSHPSSWHA